MALLGWHETSCTANHAPPPRGPSNSFCIYASSPTCPACPEHLGDRVGSEAHFLASGWGFTDPRHPAGLRFFKTDPLCSPPRINTYKRQGERPLFAQLWCHVSPFRMNTCKSVSKQRTLTPFRMNTYEKHGGWGVSQRFQFPRQPTLEGFGVAMSLGAPVNFRPRRLFPSRRFAVEFCIVFRRGESLELFWRIA